MIRLHPAATEAGVALLVHDTLDSTNAEALRLSRAGIDTPTWVVARAQTAGRGRRGRAWASEPGNLFATLLLPTDAEPTRRMHLPFVAALAVHDAIASLAPLLGNRLQLKWPNDVLLDGCKIAGILCEAEANAIAIGIGVNVVSHPTDARFPATDLRQAGVTMTADELFCALTLAMHARNLDWQRQDDFDATRKEWLWRAAFLDAPIRVALADGERHGIFESIDPRGALVLRSADGTRTIIDAGDVLAARPVPALVEA